MSVIAAGRFRSSTTRSGILVGLVIALVFVSSFLPLPHSLVVALIFVAVAVRGLKGEYMNNASSSSEEDQFEVPKQPISGSDVTRRTLLGGIAAFAGMVSAANAWGAFSGFNSTITVKTPFDAYPNRGWEQSYRDLYAYDSTFHFLCAPNDTHNCLLTSYVKNGVLVRIGPSYGYGKWSYAHENTIFHITCQ